MDVIWENNRQENVRPYISLSTFVSENDIKYGRWIGVINKEEIQGRYWLFILSVISNNEFNNLILRSFIKEM